MITVLYTVKTVSVLIEQRWRGPKNRGSRKVANRTSLGTASHRCPDRKLTASDMASLRYRSP
jgi:hypothetical protein